MSTMKPALASVELIRKLVGFPTVSRDSNLDLIEFVREYLRPYGARIRTTFDDQRRKANLFASLRSEEHTSELQSLMRISYAVFCLKKKKTTITHTQT